MTFARRKGLRYTAEPRAGRVSRAHGNVGAAFRDFCGIDLGRERAPDATTLLNFRHLLEKHQLGAALFAKVGELLLPMA